MRIHEITGSLSQLVAPVRVKPNTGTSSTKSFPHNDRQAHAQAKLGRAHSEASNLSVTSTGQIAENGTAQVMSPGEQQVKALAALAQELQSTGSKRR